MPGPKPGDGCPWVLALLMLPAGFAVALSSVLLAGRAGDALLLAGASMILSAGSVLLALHQQALRRERARRREAALLYAGICADIRAALAAEAGEQS